MSAPDLADVLREEQERAWKRTAARFAKFGWVEFREDGPPPLDLLDDAPQVAAASPDPNDPSLWNYENEQFDGLPMWRPDRDDW